MQHSSVPAPATTPAKPERKLAAVPNPRKPRSMAWAWFLGIAAVIGGAYWLYQRNLADEAIAARRAAASATRTSSVVAGKIAQTIRLTGTTGPEKFVTILGPQMRGSRSFSGGGGAFMGRSRGGSSSGGGSSQVSSNSGSSSSSSSSSATSLSGSVSSNAGSMGGSSSAGGSNASSGSMGSSGGGSSVGGVRSSANAFKATTSRSGSGGGRSSASSASAASASVSLGGDGLGSTSSSLYSGGGGSSSGGSSGGDFGSVLQDLAKPGSMVKKNSMIAEFDRQYMLQRVDDYKAGVLQQELNVKKMVANLEVTRKSHEQQILIAKSDVDKAKLDLKTIPVRSVIDIERLKLQLEEAEAKYNQLLKEVPFVRAGEDAQMKISEMDLTQSKIELRRSETNADRMIMKSPIDGMIVMLNIFRGGDMGQVQEGDPVMAGMPFMQVVDPSSMIINAVVNQSDVERIRVGAKARIRIDAFPDLELPGHVYSVAAMPKSSMSSARGSFLKEIPVRVKLDKMDPRVIPDLSVSVDVVLEEQETPAMVALSGVFHDTPAAKPYVYVRAGSNWEKRTVELGLANNIYVSIKSGLKAGEVVAEERPPIPAAGSAESSS